MYLLSFLVKAEAAKQPSSTESFRALKAALATFHSLTVPSSVSEIYNKCVRSFTCPARLDEQSTLKHMKRCRDR